MFSRTVSHGNTPYSWNITPRSGPGPATGLPSSSTRPAVGCMKPATMFIMVVLPQPDGPITETNSRVADRVATRRRPPCIGPAASGNSTDDALERRMRGGRSRDALLPGDQAPRRRAQRDVHGERDEADADDADVDDVELEERRPRSG